MISGRFSRRPARSGSPAGCWRPRCHVIGHASLTTTESFYNQARSLEASRRHQAMLADLRAAVKRGSI